MSSIPSLHRSYGVAEIVGLVEGIKASALFAQDGFGADGGAGDIFATAASVKSLRRVYRVGAGSGGAAGHPFPAPDAVAAPLPPPDTNPDKIVYLAFTSGTTGALWARA